MIPAANDDIAVYPRHTLGLVDVAKAVKGVTVGEKRGRYVEGQLVALRSRDGAPNVARVVADWGANLKVELFSVYREAWLPAVAVPRESVLGEAV